MVRRDLETCTERTVAARQLGGGVSVGASASWADLGAEQGIDQLYSGSDRILQAGSAAGVRVGLTGDFAGGRGREGRRRPRAGD